MTAHESPDASSPWPSLGLGTWRMGEKPSHRAREVAAIRTAIELGYRLFDTAEMYGEGGAESVLGSAIAEALRAEADLRREDFVVVSKLYPHHATTRGTSDACDASRKRLGLDRIDCYLLHWRGDVPLAETVAAFEGLRERGLIGEWGVSNFDVDDMEDLFAAGGRRCSVDQIYYSLTEQGPRVALLPWLERHGIVAMAYSPIDQGALAKSAALATIAARRGITAAQIALAWLLGQPGVVAIPKAIDPEHLRDNLAASQIALSAGELEAIARIHPAPKRKTTLAMR